ncbi:MAG: N-acetylmuramoyl-L-alanine amidase [Candidatus Hydrogenedentes bacterium]|nr:N-acetylmuramoyl-L-alanine amidase [Candidatus Hydrogenedentota bacterium]
MVENTAVGQERTIDVLRHGVSTPLVLPEYKSQGMGYASMRDIARQLGGAVVLKEARATFRLNSKIAVTGLNDTEVHADGTRFSLGHPILPYEDDALIAMDDVVPFLRKGFGFGTPEDPPGTSALSPPAESTPSTQDIDLDSTMDSDTLEVVVAAPALVIEDDASDLETIEIRPATEAEQKTTPLNTSGFRNRATLVLAIDAGHGGEDSGITGSNGLLEKALCLAVASDLRRILKEQYGIATIMTRDKDESVSGAVRLTQATTGKATLILSIHGGASSATEAHGFHVFAHKPKRSLSTDAKPALEAAQAIADALDSATNQAPRPVREIPLLLMRDSNLPCILVELGNLANPDDEAKLSSAAHQRSLAVALAKGIGAATGKDPATRNSS